MLFLKNGIKRENRFSERQEKRMEIIGIVLFCAVILASAKLMLDPPDRKKDPKEDEEQIEFLNEWNKKHKK